MTISIRARLLILAIVPAALLSLALLLITAAETASLTDRQTEAAASSLLALKKQEVKAYVEMAHGAVRDLYEGGAELDAALPVLKNLTYGSSGYVFGYTDDGRRVFMGHSDQGIGQSYWDLQDAEGTHLIRELIRAAKQGGGYVTYHFPKPGETVAEPKLSYAIYLERWDLMLGTGFYLDDINQILADIGTTAAESRSQTFLYLIAVSVALLGVAILLGVLIGRSIMVPIRRLTDAMQALAKGEGDLTLRMNLNDGHELGRLAAGFDRFVDSLERMIVQVRRSGSQVATASGAMRGELNGIGRLVSEQHQETDQAATAMNQMSAAAQEVARSAADAAVSARAVDKTTRAAEQVVERSRQLVTGLAEDIDHTNRAITRLEGSVQEISSVVGVIQGIAEQTNLLALNAAIEAARAGDQGRGFSVVADEVRSLATKTHASTEEIQQMIQRLEEESATAVAAMQKSHSGSAEAVGMSETARDELLQITASIHRVLEMNDVIATAAEQQNQVSEDINQRIVAIADQSTRSYDLSRSVGRDSDRLAGEAEALGRLVARFKVSA